MTPDVIVVGAGAIGCAVAYNLARRGARTLIVDPVGPGEEATGAAAGILSLLHRFDSTAPIRSIALKSLGMFPRLVEELEDESGIKTGYRRSGLLLLNSDSRNYWSRGFAKKAVRAGVLSIPVDGGAIRRLEPGLLLRESEGVYGPDECTIVPATFASALARASRRRGVRFINDRIVSFRFSGSRMVSAHSARERFQAKTFVICAGAWTGALARRQGLHIPISPTRGQLLILTGRHGIVRHVVDCGGNYLVPRGKSVVVGTTTERVGFRRGTTQAAMSRLRRFALEMSPRLGSCAEVGRTSGFRPEPSDGMPIIGQISSIENVWFASGHFRHGIILSPWTGKLMADWVLSKTVPEGMDRLSPARFERPTIKE